MRNATITSVEGVRVGHAADRKNFTGCTVVLFDKASVTAVEARGGWPGTMDTDSVGVGKTFVNKHAVFLTGGDVFGLKCAFGIQRYLMEKHLASASEPFRLPAIVGANIYDLEFGRAVEKVDYEALGYEASKNASKKQAAEGNVGAGLGATVGKLKGKGSFMKGGVGSASTTFGRFTVGAIVVVNAVGNVYGSNGKTIAGTRRTGGTGFVEMDELAEDYASTAGGKRRTSRATTIGVVATDLELSHEEAIKVVEMAHDGLARCIRPVHAATDGDTLFCVSTGVVRRGKASPDLITLVGHTAASMVQKSVLNGVLKARTLGGVPSAKSA